jgi:hypothetical protein
MSGPAACAFTAQRLEEGRDLAAAEQALLDVMALCPNHTEARRNLGVLRGQRAKVG